MVNCVKPWSTLYVMNYGYNVCCWNRKSLKKNGETCEENINDIYNSEHFVNLRKEMLETYKDDKLPKSCPENCGNAEKINEQLTQPTIDSILNGKTITDVMPSFLVAIVTHNCNIGCKMCWIFNENERNYNIDLDGFKKYLHECTVNNDKFTVSLSGGELFYDKNSKEIINYCIDKKIQMVIISNQSIYDQKLINKIIDNDVMQCLTISIDGANKKTYESIRNGANWDLVQRNLNNLLTMREKRKDSWEIQINTLIMTSTVDEIIDTINLYYKYPILVNFNYIDIHGENVNEYEHIFLVKDKYDEIVGKLNKAINHAKLLINNSDNWEFSYHDYDKYKSKTHYLELMISSLETGLKHIDDIHNNHDNELLDELPKKDRYINLKSKKIVHYIRE